jgi:hypothetical protein
MQTSTARRSTSQKLRSLPLPEAFVSGSIAAAALGKGSKADRRRAYSKADRLSVLELRGEIETTFRGPRIRRLRDAVKGGGK